MSTGSLKDLSKALHSFLPTVTLPLPDDLLQIITAYIDKHEDHDESDSQKLQDDLLAVYQALVAEKPSRLAPFLGILRLLKPILRGSGRLLVWWDKLANPILGNLGQEKGLPGEAKNTLLDILVEEEEDHDYTTTSAEIADNLMETWLKKSSLAIENFDDEAHFAERQLQLILLAFGRRRPKAFLTTINKYFVKKECRISSLSLLCEFIRHQPPHLHQMLQTPLFENLLRCLQIDTSTRVISLAMTALIMFLPHIPSSLATHLPALFNIYSRMIFWDKERRVASMTSVDWDDKQSQTSNPDKTEKSGWDKLSYILESDDDTVPELLPYFTFLYGLYPLNFMSYIRKPQKYLRHSDFAGADDLDVEPTELRERSDSFREVHLLHPNFFMMTIESELTDNNRWMKSEAADVVAECMALYSPGEESFLHASRSKGMSNNQQTDSNADVPEQSLLDEPATPFQGKSTGWRNTQSTIVASPDSSRASIVSGLHRKMSQTSQSIASVAESPNLRPSDRLDSPTLPPQLMSTRPALKDILTSKSSTRGSLRQSLANDSMLSLADSHNPEDAFHVDAFFQNMSRGSVPRSPSLRPSHTDPALRVAYLHREMQLLRNDLNFERYLKQQHLSHIGQLRRRQIREARAEAETQNLINSNRGLKSKLEDAKKTMTQMKKETEKSKSHSRKWEENLSSKLRHLREEQKRSVKEKEDLTAKFENLRRDAILLKDLVVTAEARELAAQQKVQFVESNRDELAHLRGEVEKLTAALRTYEAGELQVEQDKENLDNALRRVEILKNELRARDEELLKSKSAFENEIRDARRGEGMALNSKKTVGISQEVLDSALAVSRKRIVEIQKAHNHLLKRYNELQEAYVDLKERLDQEDTQSHNLPLLSGGKQRALLSKPESYGSQSPSPEARRKRGSPDPDPSGPSVTAGPVKLGRIDTQHSHGTQDTKSPVSGARGGMGNAASGAAEYHFGPGTSFHGSVGSDEYNLDGSGQVKIKAQSDTRVFGRGGVQNIGKKDAKKGKGKDGEPLSPTADGSTKKKKGILGFGTMSDLYDR